MMSSIETLAKQVFGKDYGGIVRIKPSKPLVNGNRSVDWPSLAESIDEAAPIISNWDRSTLMSLNPLSAKLDYCLCSHCKKPFLTKALPYHIQSSCPELKPLGPTSTTPTKSKSDLPLTSSFTSSTALSPSPRKRELEEDGSSPAPVVKKPRKPYSKRKNAATNNLGASVEDTSTVVKKEKKERIKISTANAKVPVDVEKQCGVLLPNGQLCARSLTCKSHSMGAKRAVRGRSAPYDVLLVNYQKKNQVKMASISTQQQLADENEALLGSTPINPEEEFQQVMEGVKRVYAYPLERKVIFPVKLKNQLFRMREMLAGSLLPKGLSTSSGLGGIFGRATAFNPENPDNLHFLRPPSAQRTAYLQILKQQQLRQAQMAAQNQGTTAAQNGQAPDTLARKQ